MMLVDTHCHLDFERFDEDRDAVIERALIAGVIGIIVPALDQDNIAAVLALAEQHPSVFPAVGIHPNSTAHWSPGWIDIVREAASEGEAVAVGEIGLDYYWKDSPIAVQQGAFTAQLALAAELDLPVIVHNRDASADVLALLAASDLAGRARPGVLHSFSADWATAEAALEMGFYIGITGPVTFKKADELRDIVARLPLDRILVETDAPFLAPHPYRGKRNEPAYVALVAERIAAVRGMQTDELRAATTANAVRLFGLEQRLETGHER